jgi:hypothetical protein
MRALGFEHKHAPLAPQAEFRARIAVATMASLALIVVTLGIGMAGYHWIGHLAWLDAFHQAALLLSGMGPVVNMESAASKVFDGVYALFCGIVLVAATAILFAPVIHRLLHRFHLEDAGK